MRRQISDITTTFEVTGTTAVADAFARCTAPETCGSEWTAVTDVGSGTVAVACNRCGLTGTIDLDLVAELDAGEAVTHG